LSPGERTGLVGDRRRNIAFREGGGRNVHKLWRKKSSALDVREWILLQKKRPDGT